MMRSLVRLGGLLLLTGGIAAEAVAQVSSRPPRAPRAPVAPLASSPLAHLPLPPEPPEAPHAPLAPLAMHLDDLEWAVHTNAVHLEDLDLALRTTAGALSGILRDEARFPQDPADSVYREARSLLNRGEWRKSATLFAQIAQRQPASRYAADALYWQAFALYRIGGTAELRDALVALDARRAKFPNASSKSETDALATRIGSALAARGDASARERLARTAESTGPACDAEDLSVRSSALSALMRSDPEAAERLVSTVLERRDDCSVPLRRNAVTLIGTRGDAAAKARLAEVVRKDPSPEVRSSAIGYLAKVSGDEIVATLDAVIRDDAEEDAVQRAAVRALGDHESPRAKAAIRALVERSTASERLRLEALSTFDRGVSFSYAFSTNCSGPNCAVSPVTPVPPVPPVPAVAPAPRPAPMVAGRVSGNITSTTPTAWEPRFDVRDAERRLSTEDATWLRGIYPRLETNRLKSRAVAVLSRSGDEATLTWLMALIQRDDEPADVRATVLSRLGRELPIAQLGRFYDAASTRAVREQIVSVLGDRKEPEATDKLIEIVRSGTDPSLRRSAISALTRKNDPRTTQLLLDLIGK